MKFILLLILVGMIIPSFAQESSFDDQLVNSEEYSKILNRLHSLENQNSEFTHEFQNFGNIFTSKLTEMNTSLVESGNIANKSLWLGLYVSIIFASIAIFATLWNAKVLRGQTNKIEQDVNARIRPILGRKFVNSSGTYGLKPEKMLIHLTNTGTLPALYLKMKNYVEIKNEPPENFSPNFSFDKKDNAQKYHAMGPNEFYSFDIFWPKDENNYHLLASTGKTVYFGLIIWYEDKHDHKGTEYFYHMEGHLDNGALMLDYMNMN